MATLTPNTNPSQALITVGWPLAQSNGDGVLGNNAPLEGQAVDKSNTAAATNLQTAQNIVGAGNNV